MNDVRILVKGEEIERFETDMAPVQVLDLWRVRAENLGGNVRIDIHPIDTWPTVDECPSYY